jgi:hypothetical protein
MNDKEKYKLLYGFLNGVYFWNNLTDDQRYKILTILNEVEDERDTKKN